MPFRLFTLFDRLRDLHVNGLTNYLTNLHPTPLKHSKQALVLLLLPVGDSNNLSPKDYILLGLSESCAPLV
jgi:hypothetical protein